MTKPLTKPHFWELTGSSAKDAFQLYFDPVRQIAPRLDALKRKALAAELPGQFALTQATLAAAFVHDRVRSVWHLSLALLVLVVLQTIPVAGLYLVFSLVRSVLQSYLGFIGYKYALAIFFRAAMTTSALVLGVHTTYRIVRWFLEDRHEVTSGVLPIGTLTESSFRAQISFTAVIACLFMAGLIVVKLLNVARRPEPSAIAVSSAGEILRADLKTFDSERTSARLNEVAAAREHFALGELELEQKRYTRAAAEYQDSLRALFTVSAYLNLGVALYANGMPDRAELSFRAGLRLAPKAGYDSLLVALYNNVGVASAAQNDLQNALKSYAAALAVDGGNDQSEAEAAAIANMQKLVATQEEAHVEIEGKNALFAVRTVIRHASRSPRTARRDLRLAGKMLDNIQSVAYRANPEAAEAVRTALIEFRVSAPDVSSLYWQLLSRLVTYPYLNNIDQYAIGHVLKCPPFEGMRLTDAMLVNCEELLDGKEFDSVIFRHVLVRYNGGPIELRHVTFEDCHFELHVTQTPPPDGQELGRKLLAANLTSSEVRVP